MLLKIKATDFNLEATLDSGQVFGFVKCPDGTYEGMIGNVCVKLYQEGGFLYVQRDGKGIKETSIRGYFDLSHDLETVYDSLCEDERLRPVYHQFKGLRVIQQDPWEALACFIISSNNNIKRVRLIRQNLSKKFSGNPFKFPKPSEVAQSREAELRELGLGYRAPFLLWAAKHLSEKPGSFDQIKRLGYEEAKLELTKFPGVGEKVADCTLLFGFQKYEAFPVDVWIARVMKKLYFRKQKVSEEKISNYARKRWGNLAGYVQQYLYHGAKNGVL